MWDSFWSWLDKLPTGSASFVGTLTGSSFGLLAILAGALFNAHLSRNRDDAIRNANRIALASALQAELRGIHRTLIENAQGLEERPPSEGFVVPRLTVKILPEVLDNIGILKPETIRPVMDAYILTEQYVDRLILLGGSLHPHMPIDRQLVYLDAQKTNDIIAFNKATADGVKNGIDALTPYLE